MGLFDLFSSSSSAKFGIGDFVRIRLTREEGYITTVFDDNTYGVKLNESGRTEYCKENELEEMW